MAWCAWGDKLNRMHTFKYITPGKQKTNTFMRHSTKNSPLVLSSMDVCAMAWCFVTGRLLVAPKPGHKCKSSQMGRAWTAAVHRPSVRVRSQAEWDRAIEKQENTIICPKSAQKRLFVAQMRSIHHSIMHILWMHVDQLSFLLFSAFIMVFDDEQTRTHSPVRYFNAGRTKHGDSERQTAP